MFDDKEKLKEEEKMNKIKGRKGGRSSKFQEEIENWERDVIIMEDEAI